MLNLYPYNGGHLLVCPYRHVADYTELDADETEEVAQFTKAAMTAAVQRSAAHPQGFNIRAQPGQRGRRGHPPRTSHQHIVPHAGEAGDSNFMPVIGHTRTLPQLLTDTRRLLAEAWSRLDGRRPGRPGPRAPPARRPVSRRLSRPGPAMLELGTGKVIMRATRRPCTA